MSDPLKKPAPEGHSPKEAPAIMKLAQQAQTEAEARGGPKTASSSGGSGSIPNMRGICDGMKGHNYALPDCLMFLWERLNEKPEMDFWKFAALTGDAVAQVYNRNPSTRCEYCVSGYLAGAEHIAYVFDAIGYGHSYVTAAQINADKNKYLRQIFSYIDSGLPVLVRFNMADVPGWDSDVGTWSLIVGYAGEGNTLLLNFGCLNKDGEARLLEYDASGEIRMDWIFVGQKQREITLEDIYLAAIKKMPHWLTLPERNGMFFGAAAFRAWADDIEGGRYEDEGVDLWDNYGVYVCNLATSGGEPTYLFRELAEIDPKYSDSVELGEKIQRLMPAETPTGGRSLDWIRLDALEGGLDAKREALLDREKRGEIAAVLRGRAARLDEAVRMLSPESHSPKEAPAIMRLARRAAGNAETGKAYEVKTENGGSYIDGVPALRWGQWKDNAYIGCIAAVTEALGAPVSYETLMGVSGICYRFGLKVNWCPSSEIPQNGPVWDDQIAGITGIRQYSLRDGRGRDRRARESLDAGRPVLGCGLFGSPEWDMLTGYDEKCFFGRSYFHTQGPGEPHDKPEALHTPNRYPRAENYPGEYPKGLLRFFDKPCKKEEPLALLKKSLEICLAYWNHEARADNRFGEAAYRLLIENLEKSDAAWAENCGCANYHAGSLADARRSAYVYLRDASALLGGAQRQKLLGVAGAYKSIVDGILAATPYEMLSGSWVSGGGSVPETWSRETRKALVAALVRAIGTERQIQLAVRDILAHWGEAA